MCLYSHYKGDSCTIECSHLSHSDDTRLDLGTPCQIELTQQLVDLKKEATSVVVSPACKDEAQRLCDADTQHTTRALQQGAPSSSESVETSPPLTLSLNTHAISQGERTS